MGTRPQTLVGLADSPLALATFMIDHDARSLELIARAFEAGELLTRVGDVLPLADARVAHEMLAGKPPKRGKIVLTIDQMQSAVTPA